MSVNGHDRTPAPEIYYDRNFDIQAAKILPGEYYVTGRDMLIVTVLGSCVSACIRDPISKVGGMNHFMLPEHGGDPDSPLSTSARYGAYAMEVLINNLLKMGAYRPHLEAKIFGAGRVLKGVTDVGKRNAHFAIEYLQRENIRIVKQDVGDIYPRKVYFFPHSGKVLVKSLRNMHNDTIITREVAYSKVINVDEQVSGGVDLF